MCGQQRPPGEESGYYRLTDKMDRAVKSMKAYGVWGGSPAFDVCLHEALDAVEQGRSTIARSEHGLQLKTAEAASLRKAILSAREALQAKEAEALKMKQERDVATDALGRAEERLAEEKQAQASTATEAETERDAAAARAAAAEAAVAASTIALEKTKTELVSAQSE